MTTNEHPAPIKRTRDLREELAAAEAEIKRLKRRPQERYIVRLCEGCGAAEGFDHAADCPAGYTGIAGAECDPRSADLIGRRLMDLAMERDMADAEIERLNALLDEKTGSVVTLNTQLNALHIEKRTWGKEIKRLEQQPSAKLRAAYRAWVEYVDEDGCMVGGSAATVLLRDAFDAGGFEDPPEPMTMEKADEILVKMWEECAASEDSWKVSFRRIVGRQLDYAYKAGQLLAMSEAEQPEPWDAEEIAQETADNLSKEPYMNGVYRRRILAVLNRRYPPPPSQEEREAFIKRLQEMFPEPVLADELKVALERALQISREEAITMPVVAYRAIREIANACEDHPLRTVSEVQRKAHLRDEALIEKLTAENLALKQSAAALREEAAQANRVVKRLREEIERLSYERQQWKEQAEDAEGRLANSPLDPRQASHRPRAEWRHLDHGAEPGRACAASSRRSPDLVSQVEQQRIDRIRDEAVERICDRLRRTVDLKGRNCGEDVAQYLEKKHAASELFGEPETSERVKCERCSEPGLAVYHPGECLGRSESLLDELPEDISDV